MENAQTSARTRRKRPETPLREVYRRIVGIHAALAERTNDDLESRPWAVRELMEVLHYIEDVERAADTSPEPVQTRSV